MPRRASVRHLPFPGGCRRQGASGRALALEPEEFWKIAARPCGPAESTPLPAYPMLRLLAGGPSAPAGDVPLRGSILGYLQMQSNTDFVSATSLGFDRELQ